MFSRLRPLLFLALIVAVASGCGGRSSSRSVKFYGKVTYKGAPVTGANMVAYAGEVGNPIAVAADGSFNASQLPAGDFVVTVENEFLNPDKPDYAGKKGMGSPMPAGKGAPAGVYIKLPEKYKKKETSDLKITLVNGNNEKEIVLTD